jgi:hypothetical protein
MTEEVVPETEDDPHKFPEYQDVRWQQVLAVTMFDLFNRYGSKPVPADVYYRAVSYTFSSQPKALAHFKKADEDEIKAFISRNSSRFKGISSDAVLVAAQNPVVFDATLDWAIIRQSFLLDISTAASRALVERLMHAKKQNPAQYDVIAQESYELCKEVKEVFSISEIEKEALYAFFLKKLENCQVAQDIQKVRDEMRAILAYAVELQRLALPEKFEKAGGTARSKSMFFAALAYKKHANKQEEFLASVDGLGLRGAKFDSVLNKVKNPSNLFLAHRREVLGEDLADFLRPEKKPKAILKMASLKTDLMAAFQVVGAKLAQGVHARRLAEPENLITTEYVPPLNLSAHEEFLLSADAAQWPKIIHGNPHKVAPAEKPAIATEVLAPAVPKALTEEEIKRIIGTATPQEVTVEMIVKNPVVRVVVGFVALCAVFCGGKGAINVYEDMQENAEKTRITEASFEPVLDIDRLYRVCQPDALDTLYRNGSLEYPAALDMCAAAKEVFIAEQVEIKGLEARQAELSAMFDDIKAGPR